MPSFRPKTPQTVNAVQFTGSNDGEVAAAVPPGVTVRRPAQLFVGGEGVGVGDYVVVQGSTVRVMSKSAFEEKYEADALP